MNWGLDGKNYYGKIHVEKEEKFQGDSGFQVSNYDKEKHSWIEIQGPDQKKMKFRCPIQSFSHLHDQKPVYFLNILNYLNRLIAWIFQMEVN